MAQTAFQMKMLWRSGFLNRWHTNDDDRLRNSRDTNDAHSNRVAKLCYMLNPDDYRAIVHATMHDCPEKLTGDVSYVVKRVQPEMVALLAKMDAFYWESVGVDPVPNGSTPLCRLADQIDSLLFCQTYAPDLWRRADWQDHYAHVMAMAAAYGVTDVVQALVDETGRTL